MNKLVSIIIRTKNEERWISSCLRSVFRQNYKNIEVIYTTLPTNLNEISPIFKNDCLESKNINKILVRHNIKNCF